MTAKCILELEVCLNLTMVCTNGGTRAGTGVGNPNPNISWFTDYFQNLVIFKNGVSISKGVLKHPERG